MARNASLCSFALPIVISLLSAVGCTPRLTDETFPSARFNPASNVHRFTAAVRPPSSPAGSEIRAVTLELEGRSVPMIRLADGKRWRVETPLFPCETVVPYRYLVEYDEDGAPPFNRTVFPEHGHFILRVEPPPAQCADPQSGPRTFHVDTSMDLVDPTPGDGICGSGGQTRTCSLRAAVMEANALDGIDRIELQPGTHTLTRTGTEAPDVPDETVGDLDVVDSVVIEALCPPDVTAFLDPGDQFRSRPELTLHSRIDGGGIDRVLDVYAESPGGAPVEVYLNCVHITGGALRSDSRFGDSPPLRGAGILNRGTLVIDRAAITENTLEANQSFGVGIYSVGRLTVRRTAFIGNQGYDGGGLFGGAEGGGIYCGELGRAVVDSSVFAYNRAAKAPGIGSRASWCSVSIVNSTFFEHEFGRSQGARGSVLVNGRGDMTLRFSTLYDLSAPLAHNDEGTFVVDNSLLGGDCHDERPNPVTSSGGNWFTDTTCGSLGSVDHTTGFLAMSSSLEMGGGFTPVLRLFTRHPDAPPEVYIGDTSFADDWFCPEVDQRGFPRPVDADGDGVARCDPGAFEIQSSIH